MGFKGLGFRVWGSGFRVRALCNLGELLSSELDEDDEEVVEVLREYFSEGCRCLRVQGSELV